MLSNLISVVVVYKRFLILLTCLGLDNYGLQ